MILKENGVQLDFINPFLRFTQRKRVILQSERKNHMQGRYKVITLCGSTKFKEEFLEIQKKLTQEGYIVISVGLFGHSGEQL